MHPGKLQPSETSELIERLEDSLMTLGGMATNRYAGPFRGGESLLASCAWSWHRHCSVADTSVHLCRWPAEIQELMSNLSTVSETIEQWLMVQNMWQYMEAVFRWVLMRASGREGCRCGGFC